MAEEIAYKEELNFKMEDDVTSVIRSRNISGDEEFYANMNRVLGNLKLIRQAQPNCGILISFVTNTAGETFKIVLN